MLSSSFVITLVGDNFFRCGRTEINGQHSTIIVTSVNKNTTKTNEC